MQRKVVLFRGEPCAGNDSCIRASGHEDAAHFKQRFAGCFFEIAPSGGGAF